GGGECFRVVNRGRRRHRGRGEERRRGGQDHSHLDRRRCDLGISGRQKAARRGGVNRQEIVSVRVSVLVFSFHLLVAETCTTIVPLIPHARHVTKKADSRQLENVQDAAGGAA